MTIERSRETLTLEELYTHTPENEQFEQDLKKSLEPRSMDMLVDLVSETGLSGGGKVVDVGCGTADHACVIAERFGVDVLAIDVVPSLLDASRARVGAAGLEGRVDVRDASIHAIPAESESCDLVWCRDMLNHVTDVEAAFRECHRVLRPGRMMILYQAFAGDVIEAEEAERLYAALGIVPENMHMEHIERACGAAGFSIAKKDVIAGEWREWEVEKGEQTALDALLRAARLLRRREYFVKKFGEGRYEQALGDAQWFPFIMLGKLLPVAYLLKKSSV